MVGEVKSKSASDSFSVSQSAPIMLRSGIRMDPSGISSKSPVTTLL